MSGDLFKITDPTGAEIAVTSLGHRVLLAAEATDPASGIRVGAVPVLTVTQALALGNELIRCASAIQGSSAASAQAWHGTEGPK